MLKNLIKSVSISLLILLTSCSNSETELQEAIDLSRKAIESKKISQNPMLNIEEVTKLIAESNEKFQLSLDIYNRLLTNEPENAMYHNNIGWIKMNMGNYKAARNHFETALKFPQRFTPESALTDNLTILNNLESQENIPRNNL